MSSAVAFWVQVLCESKPSVPSLNSKELDCWSHQRMSVCEKLPSRPLKCLSFRIPTSGG